MKTETIALEKELELNSFGTLMALAGTFLPVMRGGLPRLVSTPPGLHDDESFESRALKAEWRYQALVEQIPVVAFLISFASKKNEIYVSSHVEKLLGYTAKEWTEDPVLWYQRLYPGDRTRWNVEFSRTVAMAEPFKGDYRFLAKNGRIVWIHGEVTVVRDESGRPSFLQGVGYEITDLKRAEEVLRRSGEELDQLVKERTNEITLVNRSLQSEIRLRELTESVMRDNLKELADVKAALDEHAIVGITDPQGKITYANDKFCATSKYSREELIGQDHRLINSGHHSTEFMRQLWDTITRGKVWKGEILNRAKDGNLYWVDTTIVPFIDAISKPYQYVSIQADITERKRFEAALLQSQKMETIGKLAGGIAHEFNSILTAIIGQSELMLAELPAVSPLAANAVEINQAAVRAAALTRQLLAYGRKQMMRPETLELNRIIAGMEGVFQNLMGAEVTVRILPDPSLHLIKADAGQIEQVIMNMAMNARDAMPCGGTFTIGTAHISLDQNGVSRFPEMKPGDYVTVTITDTGDGMSEQIKARVFEPFFTTKPVGHGSGLGLSTCYGIVKQSGGHISVWSEPGSGSVFKIYLPQVEPEAKTAFQGSAPADLPSGTETILLVEAHTTLREMATTLLRRLGYTVWPAASALEALTLQEQRNLGKIDLLLTDTSPQATSASGLSGLTSQRLAERVQAQSPDAKILFTSAGAENPALQKSADGPHPAITHLQKPFTPSALARKIREALARVEHLHQGETIREISGDFAPPDAPQSPPRCS